jgi:vacuolar iron transporter family protein
MHVKHNPNYIHHQKSSIIGTIREVVFGMEDGMVSTLGAITGIAAATQDYFTVLLAGFVVVSVESISMAVGSYISSKSKRAIDERKLFEETEELHNFPVEEKKELVGMYLEDGWTEELAVQMAEQASQNKELFLKEMAYRELKIFPDGLEDPLKNGIFMGGSYIIGGFIPLVPYLFFSIQIALPISIICTLCALFALGAWVTKYSKRSWVKAGLEMVALAGVAALVGFGVGQLIELFVL